MKVNRTEFYRILSDIKLGLASKEFIEQTSSFIFKDNKVFAYNDQILACAEFESEINGVVQAEPLLKILQKTKEDEITIELKESEMLLKGKRFSSGIKFTSEIKLPIDDMDLDQKFQKVPDNFVQLVRLACYTTGTSISDQILSCVHFDHSKVESCDNDRITICKFDDFDIGGEFLVQGKNLMQVLKLEIDSVAFSPTWMYFKLKDNSTIIACRLYMDQYLNLESHIPEEDGREIQFPKEIEDIIDRADIFSKNEMTAEKNVHIDLNDGKLVISTKNDNGWFKERAKVTSKETLKFSINTDFFKDIIKLSDTISVIDDVLLFEDTNSMHFIKLEMPDE